MSPLLSPLSYGPGAGAAIAPDLATILAEQGGEKAPKMARGPAEGGFCGVPSQAALGSSSGEGEED